MRALRFADGSAAVVDVPEPDVGPGETRVRVSLAGICGTDLELLAGYKAFAGTPGHEFVGRVVEPIRGSTRDSERGGRRVVASINAGCRACAACRVAGEGHCPDRRVLGILGWDGALAEQVVVPTRSLIDVPDSVSDAAAVFAEPLAAALRIAQQVAVDERRVVVVGAGRLGILCALALEARGAHVTGVARHARAADILHAAGIETVSSTHELSPEFDVVVDATGAPDGLADALRLVRPRGVLVVKSTCAPGQDVSALDPTELVVREVTVVGSRCGDLREALDVLTTRAIATAPLVDAILPLEDGVEGLERAARSGALKVLLAPGE